MTRLIVTASISVSDTMSLLCNRRLWKKRKRGSPVNGVHVAAGRTKAGMTAERNEFEISAGGEGELKCRRLFFEAEVSGFKLAGSNVTIVLQNCNLV